MKVKIRFFARMTTRSSWQIQTHHEKAREFLAWSPRSILRKPRHRTLPVYGCGGSKAEASPGMFLHVSPHPCETGSILLRNFHLGRTRDNSLKTANHHQYA